MERIDADFTSRGTRCAAWLFLPDGQTKPPVVVMAHGMGGLRSFRLPAFAEVFARRGLATLVFDYRTFGDSDGSPRQDIHPQRQLEDWQAAIAHARQMEQVDGRRLALWGTSFSGGHVLATASRTPGIAAVVSQVPFVDSFDSIGRQSLGWLTRLTVAALRDTVGRVVAGKAHYLPLLGKPGDFALMNTPESWDGYRAIVDPGARWDNHCTARSFLVPYRPCANVEAIDCPVQLICGEQDSLISLTATEKVARRIRGVDFVKLPVNHFAPYIGETFDRVSALEADFLCHHLL